MHNDPTIRYVVRDDPPRARPGKKYPRKNRGTQGWYLRKVRRELEFSVWEMAVLLDGPRPDPYLVDRVEWGEDVMPDRWFGRLRTLGVRVPRTARKGPWVQRVPDGSLRFDAWRDVPYESHLEAQRIVAEVAASGEGMQQIDIAKIMGVSRERVRQTLATGLDMFSRVDGLRDQYQLLEELREQRVAGFAKSRGKQRVYASHLSFEVDDSDPYISEDTLDDVRSGIKSGKTIMDIARELELHYVTVRNYVRVLERRGETRGIRVRTGLPRGGDLRTYSPKP